MTIGWFSCAPTASSVRFLQFISIGYINLYLLGKKFFLSFTHLCLLVIYNNFARPVLLSWYIPKVQWPFWAGNQVRHFENARCAAFVSTGKRPFFFPLSLPLSVQQRQGNVEIKDELGQTYLIRCGFVFYGFPDYFSFSVLFVAVSAVNLISMSAATFRVPC